MTEATVAGAVQEEEDVVLYRRAGETAVITMNRPQYRNAQNSEMTYALDEAFYRAADDDEVKVVVLGGSGEHFSAGHDIGTPGRDIGQSFPRSGAVVGPRRQARGGEPVRPRAEVYLGMCRRWRELPKPTIAMVQGACIAGGLMLAWVCDLIVASDDAFFADPVVQDGHPRRRVLRPPGHARPAHRQGVPVHWATGSPPPARYELGMVNRVVPRDELEAERWPWPPASRRCPAWAWR